MVSETRTCNKRYTSTKKWTFIHTVQNDKIECVVLTKILIHTHIHFNNNGSDDSGDDGVSDDTSSLSKRCSEYYIL